MGGTFIGHDTSAKCNLTKYTDVFSFHLWFYGRPQTGQVNVTDVFILLSNSTRSCTVLLRLSPRHVIEQFPGQFSHSNFKVMDRFPSSFKRDFYMMKGDKATFLMSLSSWLIFVPQQITGRFSHTTHWDRFCAQVNLMYFVKEQLTRLIVTMKSKSTFCVRY